MYNAVFHVAYFNVISDYFFSIYCPTSHVKTIHLQIKLQSFQGTFRKRATNLHTKTRRIYRIKRDFRSVKQLANR